MRQINKLVAERVRDRRWSSVWACIAGLTLFGVAARQAGAQQGDINCDGAVSVADVSLFVEALLQSGSFAGCDINRADMNGDAAIDGRDMQPFVTALLTPICSGGATWCAGVCTNVAFDPLNCGGCGIVCDEPGKECCSGGVCQSCW